MEKKLAILIFLGLVLPLLVLAVTIENPLPLKDFGELISNVVDFIFNIALVVMPLIIIIGGIYFVLSGGKPEEIQKARTLIYYAIVGFIIIILAKGIVALFEEAFGIK